MLCHTRRGCAEALRHNRRMVLNLIWVGFFLVAILTALVRLLQGDAAVFPALMGAMFDSAKTGFEISLGLVGVMALWLGIMRVGEQAGVIDAFARLVNPLFSLLFPSVPRGHAAQGAVMMNVSANLLGLDNAATPLGLKAMRELQTLNAVPARASDAQIMFIVLNTAGLTLIPTAVIAMLVMVSLVLGRRLPLPSTLEPPPVPPRSVSIVNWTVEVTAGGLPALGDLRSRYTGIAFSRVERGGQVHVATAEHRLEPGDVVVVLGPEASVAAFAHDVGTRSDRHLPLDRSQLDFRRIVVSNRRLAGQRLAALDLPHLYGVVPTRVRRGDDDFVASDDFELELGDRVRVVGPSEQLAPVARLLGDSERRLSEVDALGFALGATAGLLLGTATLHLGSIDLELGVGGGPLVVGLVLGVISRTGPITWQIPHGANSVLRQLGILMFLACAGLGSGTAFADSVGTRHGLELVLAGVVVGGAFAAIVPLVVTIVARRHAVETAGMLAGIETQPAALAYAIERTGGDERISRAYAVVFPAAMIAKVVAVQLLV